MCVADGRKPSVGELVHVETERRADLRSAMAAFEDAFAAGLV